MKQCNKCQQMLPPTDFWKDKYAPDGLWRTCKTCGGAHNKAAYHRDKERLLNDNRNWRDAHKEQVAARKSRKRTERLQWLVYRLDFPEGYYYVGSTCDLPGRVSVHKSTMRAGVHRNPRIREKTWGPDSFSVQVLFTAASREEVQTFEATCLAAGAKDTYCLNTLQLPSRLP